MWTGTSTSVRLSSRRSPWIGTVSGGTSMDTPGRSVAARSTASATVSRRYSADEGLPVTRTDVSSATVPAAYATRTGTSRVTARESVTVTVVVPTLTPLT